VTDTDKVITRTKKWITDVVIGCNFCPFAQKEMKKDSVHYYVADNANLKVALEFLIKECTRLDEDPAVETSFLIFSNSFEKFTDYLHLVDIAEQLLKKEGYEGIYQLASFHPLYQFAGTAIDDASNYTNRSIYPMLHLLREESIENALANFPDADRIFERNINFTHSKGEVYMKLLRDACIE